MGDMRKIQRTPSGTFFVCLPKAWAEQCGLERGAVVALTEAEDGKLLVDPKYGAEPSPHAIVLKPGPFLSREITANYLLGFDTIRVEAKERMSHEARDAVKKAVSRLVGLEIVEEDYSSIVLQCLLVPSGVPPEKMLRRGYAIAAGMHRDVVSALIDGDVHLAASVIDRDDEVNRLHFLLVRVLRTIIQSRGLSEKLGVRQIECLDYRLVASLVEGIGDECAVAAQKVVDLEGAKLSADLKKAFVAFHTVCFAAHENALRAFFTGDMKTAEEVRCTREKVENLFADIEKNARAQSLEIVPQVLAVASSLKQIYEHGVDISDLVMPREVQAGKLKQEDR
jgi:phosphate uptake regulator